MLLKDARLPMCFTFSRRSNELQVNATSAQGTSHGLGLRSKMELFNFQGWGHRGAVALGFRTADAFGGTDHLDITRGQQFQNTLIESEIAHRVLNFFILNVPNSIPGKAGEKGGSRV